MKTSIRYVYMPFTVSEKHRLIAALQSKGWKLENDTVWSPSRGLYFNESHFESWTPAEMREVFTQRGGRIQRAEFDGWELSVGEHQDVCSAAEYALGEPSL